MILIFLNFYFIFFGFSKIFFFFLGGGVEFFCNGFFSRLLRLLLKITKVTTGHQNWPKMGQNSIIGVAGPIF